MLRGARRAVVDSGRVQVREVGSEREMKWVRREGRAVVR
jgi:hypothetical protein